MTKADFFNAIKAGDQDAIDKCLEENPEYVDSNDENGVSSVLLALYSNEPEIARKLSELKKTITFFEASAMGNVNLMEQIVSSSNVKINAYSPDGFQALGYASFNHEDAARYLLDHGAEVNAPSKNSFGVYPVHSAAAARNNTILGWLLEAGADPNATQSGEFTPLHTAADHGDTEMIHLLLRFGASIYAMTKDGRSPRQIAITARHTEAASLL